MTPADGAPAPDVDRVDVSLDLSCQVTRAGRIAFCLSVAEHLMPDDELTVTGPDGPLTLEPLLLPHGTRVHVVDAPEGVLSLTYRARVERGGPTESAPVTDADRLTYLLPSRYCPNDRIGGWATAEFGSAVDDTERVLRVVEWVHDRTTYTPGSTGPTDDALAPLLTGQGVCRDYAHLVVATLRALDIPARYVSVYAPGLDPMDAHAVVEVALGDRWYVVDATRLAPRRSMVRSGTGRDAADTALMTTMGGETDPPFLSVTCVAQPDLPPEDPAALVTLR